MKFFLICSLLAIVSADRMPGEKEAILFNNYLSEFRVKIGRTNADSIREIFMRNYYDIEEHNEAFNNGTESFTREINKFAHLTEEEFFESHSGYVPAADNATLVSHAPLRSGRLATPVSWSWTDMPWSVGPVTDQGDCGSGAIFATIGVIESHMRIWYGYDTKLSEQEAMPCCGGCLGGTNSYVYDFAKNGVTFENELIYQAQITELCNTDRPRAPGSKVLNFYRIKKGVDAVSSGLWFLTNVGPLATSMCFPASFITYGTGVFDDENLSNCVWHALMVVGFGNLNGKNYWLVRNSWGGWGIDGYAKIARGKNLGGIEDDFTFPLLKY